MDSSVAYLCIGALLVLSVLLIILLVLYMTRCRELCFLHHGRDFTWGDLWGELGGGRLVRVHEFLNDRGVGPQVALEALAAELDGAGFEVEFVALPIARFFSRSCRGGVRGAHYESRAALAVGSLQLHLDRDWQLFAVHAGERRKFWLVLGCWDLQEPGSVEGVVGFVRAYSSYSGGA